MREYYSVQQTRPNGHHYGYFLAWHEEHAKARAMEEHSAIPTPSEDSRWPRESEVYDGFAVVKTESVVLSQAGEDYEDRMHPAPDFGAILTFDWAVEDRSEEQWFADVSAAREALRGVVKAEGGELSDDGWRADLTWPGCHNSRGFVTRLNGRSDKEVVNLDDWIRESDALLGQLGHTGELAEFVSDSLRDGLAELLETAKRERAKWHISHEGPARGSLAS